MECTADVTKCRVREPPPKPAGGDSKDRSGAATASENPAGAVRRRSPPGPGDVSSAKQSRPDDPTPPDSGGAHTPLADIPSPSTPVATSSSAVENTSEQNKAQVTGRAAGKGDEWRVAANSTAEENTCHWGRDGRPRHGCSNRRSRKIARSHSWIGRPWLPAITWARRGSCAATERAWCTCNTSRSTECTKSLTCHSGQSPLSVPWMDRDDNSTAKARLTAGGYEQELTGQETFYSATPQPATLRTLLVVAQSLGLGVAVDCGQALPEHPSSRSAMYVSRLRWKRQWNLDEHGVYSRLCQA